MFSFSRSDANPLTAFSLSERGCKVQWWSGEGCRLLTVPPVINGHSKDSRALRIDSAFALEGTADNGV